MRKPAFLKNRFFASEDVLRPLEGASGSDSIHLVSTQKKVLTSKNVLKIFFGASRSPEGAPQMAASPIDCIFTMPRATARLTAFLQGGRAQGAIIHCKNAVDLLCERARTRRSQDGIFPLPGGSWGARSAPQKSFENQRGPPRWPQARLTAFLQGAVTPSRRIKKFQKKVFKLDTFLKKAVSKFEVDRRLQSLHFKDVF